MPLLIQPLPPLVEAFRRAVSTRVDPETAMVVEGAKRFPVIRDGDRVVILADPGDDFNREALKTKWVYEPPQETAEVWVALGQNAIDEPTTISLGIRAVNHHDAIAAIAGLPSGWRKVQIEAVDQVLRPLRIGDADEATVADLYANPGGERVSAAGLIDSRGLMWDGPAGQLVYFLAEAGKGKSTLFGDAVARGLRGGSGPLPLYAALRSLPRGAGISWDQIARELGAGSGAGRLAAAVKAGLVTPFLDGLDEVSGRYDPRIIEGVAEAVRDALLGSHARVFLSGRTTEASALDGFGAARVGVELPLSHEPAFRTYAQHVTEAVVTQWGALAQRVPEPAGLGLDIALRRDDGSPPSERQREDIMRWVEASFDELGKDRSLFFVQSLAFIARSYQLNGNRALVIDQPGAEPSDAKLAEARALDACILAASLACAREQAKVEDIAGDIFTPQSQLDILTAFALLASAADDLRSEFPSPREIVRRATRVDAVGQLEEFVAMDRQMQKHALLIAQEGSVGDWTPAFLSDWVRSALLVQAWRRASSGGTIVGLDSDLVRRVVVQAQRARFAFSVLFVEDAERDADYLADLDDAVWEHAGEIPEAAANGLFLRAARSFPVHPADSFPAFTDVTGIDADSIDFTDIQASYLLAGDASFEGCSFSQCAFDVCDLPGATFSNCTLREVAFRECTGPVTFVGCTFEACSWTDASSAKRPAWAFVDCTFDDACLIEQTVMTRPEDPLDIDAVVFDGCTTSGEIRELLGGEWIRSGGDVLNGIETESSGTARSPGERALRSVLRTFFPTWTGEGQPPQARRYIRSSALGRGAVPAGMPSNSALVDILYAEGFSDGGRDNHVYAPWSQVGGRTALGLEQRSAYLDYLVDGKRSSHVDSLQRRIERAAGWAT